MLVEILQQEVDDFAFCRGIRGGNKVVDGRAPLIELAARIGKFQEAGVAVGLAHPAVADTAEGEEVVGNLQQTHIHCRSSGAGVALDVVMFLRDFA